jgi:hypothetical protein
MVLAKIMIVCVALFVGQTVLTLGLTAQCRRWPILRQLQLLPGSTVRGTRLARGKILLNISAINRPVRIYLVIYIYRERECCDCFLSLSLCIYI